MTYAALSLQTPVNDGFLVHPSCVSEAVIYR